MASQIFLHLQFIQINALNKYKLILIWLFIIQNYEDSIYVLISTNDRYNFSDQERNHDFLQLLPYFYMVDFLKIQ
jgi:hypothetical protein